VSYQGSPRAHTSSSGGGFGTGMPPTNHNDIKHVHGTLLSDDTIATMV
jgi:hypothetical protein